jgi:predicted transposase YdaD
MYKTMKTYKELKPFDDKNVFLDRVAKANPIAFKEAMTMFTEGIREIFMEGAEQHGWLDNWLDNRETKKAKDIAKKLLLLGDSPEKVAEATELPLDIVVEIANQMQELPIGVS